VSFRLLCDDGAGGWSQGITPLLLVQVLEDTTLRSVARLDSNGIPRVWGRVTGIVHRPGFVAMYELNNFRSLFAK